MSPYDDVFAVDAGRGATENAVLDIEIDHFGVIDDVDAKAGRREIQGVQHGAAAAEEKAVGAAEAERASERRLEPDALGADPIEHRARLFDHEPRELFVGVPFGDPFQIVPEFVFGIGARQRFRRGLVRAPHIAGVACVAASVELRGGLDDQHRSTRAARADRRA